MPRKKVRRMVDGRLVIYDLSRWRLLREFREKALQILVSLSKFGLEAVVYGSIARGDVNRDSDIDVALLYPVPPYIIETALDSAGFTVMQREIAQATPIHALKGHLYLDEKTVITIPLTHLNRLEREFYSFGGELDEKGLRENRRVAGVDKRLMLIYPVKRGHVESSIIGREEEVASLLNVSLDIVMEREKVLLRRDEKGRTGVFIRKVLGANESFENALKKLANSNYMVRKRLRKEGIL